MKMREQILKIQVNTSTYKTISQFACREVPFIGLSDHQPIRQMDFIIFTDGNGNETLRNMWELKGNTICYTDCLNIAHSDCFSLVVVLSHMYNSIMHLRYDAYTDRLVFLNHFPINMVDHEVRIISLCTEFLCEMINIKQYIDNLKILTDENQDYYFASSAAILEAYPWDFRINDQNLISIDKIRHGITEIRKCMDNKKEWRNIWQIAYNIHNEPARIYEYR